MTSPGPRALTPARRATIGLLGAACALCLVMVGVVRPVVLVIAVQMALVLAMALLLWRWGRLSAWVPATAALPLLAAVIAAVVALR